MGVDAGGAMDQQLMPAAFVGHGTTMNALERNRYTSAWRAFGAAVPRPRAIVVVSAHWFVNVSAVTAMAQPRTIHDFYGFPDELFALQYPAPGAPEVAEELAEIVKPSFVAMDVDAWGLDHGTWSVLVHMFPDADIPVLQLSIHALEPLAYHVELGARLAPLRERGVLIVASGNVVHNLRRLDWSSADGAFDWARRFGEDTTELLTTRPGAAASLERHPDYGAAVPTTDHFLPMLYIAGLADAAGATLDPFAEGYAFGGLSMTCYSLGAPPVRSSTDVDTSARDIADVPPEQSNI
jgi:4,5-DOPA dioxygenase extradiol